MMMGVWDLGETVLTGAGFVEEERRMQRAASTCRRGANTLLRDTLGPPVSKTVVKHISRNGYQ
jgi:hypothetical protein